MRRRFQRQVAARDPRAVNQYHFPSDGRIRRRLLEDTLDGMDYYGEAFQALRLSGEESILNIGTGDGWDEVRLATEFGHKGPITGIDIPVEGMDFDDNFTVARSMLGKAGITNVSFQTGNAMALDFNDNSFDVVIWGHCGYHFTDIRLAISETVRVLKHKGRLLNLTNGDFNKYRHHKMVGDIKAELGHDHHEPFSAPFNLRTSRQALRNLVGPLLVPVKQTSLYRVVEATLPLLELSIDTYRGTVPHESVNDWIAVREQIIDDCVTPYTRNGGTFLDFAYRGGGVYENAKIRNGIQVYLGRSALSNK